VRRSVGGGFIIGSSATTDNKNEEPSSLLRSVPTKSLYVDIVVSRVLRNQKYTADIMKCSIEL